MHYLYRITDKLNNKVYIGQSNKENERWRQHKYYARQEKPIQYISRAIKKYGVENFIYEVIACCHTQEDADELETQLIKQYDSQNSKLGYNIAPGGDLIIPWNKGLPKEQQPMYGKKQSDYQKKITSEVHGGKRAPHSEEWKIKVSASLIGHTILEETKQKISKAKTGKITSDETKRKQSLVRVGRFGGEKHPGAKLTWTLVAQIRQEYKNGNTTHKALAEKYGVKQTTITEIINYKAWII